MKKSKDNLTRKILLVSMTIVLMVSTVFAGCGNGEQAGGNYSSSKTSDSISDSDLNYVSLDDGFTDVIISNEKSAIEAVATVADMLGIDNPENELKVSSVDAVDGDKYYRIQQYCGDIPIYGRNVVVTADENGNAVSLTSNTVNVTEAFDENALIGSDTIIDNVSKYLKKEISKSIDIYYIDDPTNDKIVYYCFDDEDAYAYKLFVNSDNGVYDVFVNAYTGDVIYANEKANFEQKNFVLKGQKKSQTFIAETNNTTNSMTYVSKTGTIINVLIANSGHKNDWYEDGNSTIVQWTNSESPDESAVDAITNITYTYNYYLDKFNRDSYSGNGEDINVYVHNETLKNNAFYSETPNGPVFAFCKCYDSSGNEKNEYSSEIDVIGHEYTHGVVDFTSGLTDTEKNLMPGAINEGVADILGLIIEEKNTGNTIDWQIDEIRTDIKGGEYSSDQIYHTDDYTEKTTECHTASTIISYSAYLMWNGIDGNDSKKIDTDLLSNIWYRAILSMQSDATFTQCADAVYKAAKTVKGVTTEQLNCIVEAFENVGINVNTGTSVKASAGALLYVKDTNGSNYGNYHIKISELINSKSSRDVLEEDITDNSGYSLDLEKGTYYVKVTDNDPNGSELEYVISLKIVDDKTKGNKSPVNIYTNFGSVAIDDFTIQDDMVLTIGEIDVIEPETVPMDATGYSLNWSSSDESIATVSQTGEVGIVTAKSKGTTTITAQLESNGKTITKTTDVRVASQGRDTILVLDISGSMSGTPLTEMKESAINFCNELLADEYNNRVGLVLYDDYITTVDLTNDLDTLIEDIESLSSGATTNMEGALAAAENMMDTMGKDDNIKNIVIMADGLPNEGETSDYGPMSSYTQYSSYSSDVYYANAVINRAQSIMNKYNMYSLGFFHDLSGVEKDFAVDLMTLLTNMDDGYHQVDTAENLQFAFGDIQETISDGSKIIINIACPVDVYVTYGDETLSSSANSYSDYTSFGTLQLLGQNQDIKVLSLNPNIDYDIELVGTDAGTMDYSINYIDDNENIVDYRNFETIPITSTTIITSNTDNTVSTVELNVDEDGDGEIDYVWSAMASSSATLTYGDVEPESEVYDDSEMYDEQPINENDDSWKIVMVSVIVVFIVLAIILIVVFLVVTGKKKDSVIEIPIKEQSSTKNDTQHLNLVSDSSDEVVENFVVVITNGSMAGSRFNLDANETYIIGKGADHTQINLSSDYENVSRKHCIVNCDEKENCYYVTDSSMNGTSFKNGRKLTKNHPTKIERGTVLRLANEKCEILFE